MTAPAAPPAEGATPGATSVDSPPVGEQVLSGHNFREVAPEILSPLSWSVVGAGMEAGMRQVARALHLPVPGRAPRFVAYLAFRPYHVADAMERLLGAVPAGRSDDLWLLVFGGPRPVLPTAPGSRIRRSLGLLPTIRIVTANGGIARRIAAEVARAETAVARALALGSPDLVGSALEGAVDAGRQAWALHMRTTCHTVVSACLLRAALERDFGPETAVDLLRVSARRSAEAGAPSVAPGLLVGASERMVHYEVADGSARFPAAPPGLGPGAGGASAAGSGGVTWTGKDVLGRSAARQRVNAALTALFELGLGEREESKRLALRALHGIRLLLDAGVRGLPAADAALLSAHELLVDDATTQRATIERRAGELEGARATPMPVDLRRSGSRLRALPRPMAVLGADAGAAGARGRGLADGRCHGTLTRPPGPDGAGGDRGEDDPILVGHRVEASDVLRIRPVGVVSELGSVLSHLAIICRELGIPLVAGVRVDDDLLGAGATVDGHLGEVALSRA